MTIFDQLFLFLVSSYKPKFKNKANRIALFYISVLQISLWFLIGVFFIVFLTKMHTNVISNDKAVILFILSSLGIHFKNWIKYSGKSRMVMNAKSKKRKNYNLYLLLGLPFACIGLGLILLQAIL